MAPQGLKEHGVNRASIEAYTELVSVDKKTLRLYTECVMPMVVDYSSLASFRGNTVPISATFGD